MVRRGVLAEVLGHPLMVALIGAMFAGYAGYATGQTSITARIERLEEISRHHSQQLAGRTEFMTCAVRHIDAIEAQAKGPPDCQLSVPE